jgi:UrcA family protein
MTRIIATLLAACTLAGAGAASAQTARIPFGDLDLASTEGAAAFDARVDAAARKFCRQANPVSRISERSACEQAVRDEALAQLPTHAQVRYAVSRLPVVA